MTNERKILTFCALIFVAVGGLALVMHYRTTEFAPPPPATEKPAPPIEEVKDVEISKTFTSEDRITTVTVSAWNEKQKALLIENPTVITGTTTAFESRIAWKMTDAAGRIISEGGTQVASPDAGVPGPFQISLFYDGAPAMDRGFLRVFEFSAKDGEPIHEVNIPIAFLYTAGKGNGCEARVNVAFTNTKEDPNMLDCSKTGTVERIVCGTSSTASLVAIHELLKGPTGSEKERGFVTNLPANVPDPRVGRTYDFDSTLEAGVAGSCRVGAIRAQIENTIRMNSSASDKEVVISIDGRTDDILQP